MELIGELFLGEDGGQEKPLIPGEVVAMGLTPRPWRHEGPLRGYGRGQGSLGLLWEGGMRRLI